MSRNHFFFTLFSGLVLYAATAFGGSPILVSSSPENGAANVPLSQGKIVLRFSENMKMSSWSLMESKAHPFPSILPIEEPWVDPLTFEFQVKTLQPNTTYAIQLNGEKRKGFLSSADQSPLPITTITFSTATQGSPLQSGTTRDTPSSIGASPPLQPAPAVKPVGIAPGWRFKVTRSTGMEGNETYQSGEQAPFRVFQKIVFIEEVSKTSGAEIQEASRQIESAQFHSLNPMSGEMEAEELVAPGSTFLVSHTPYGTTLVDGDSGQEVWDPEVASAFSPPLVPRLWPEGALRVGQKWSYQGSELVSRIALIDALGGKIDLQVDEIMAEPSTGLDTAAIRGKLRTKVDLGVVVLDFDAKVEIDLPLAVGIPFMVKFEGQLSGAGEAEDERGQPVSYKIQGTGSVLQVTQSSDKVLAAAGAQLSGQDEPVDTTGALRVPIPGNMGQTNRGGAAVNLRSKTTDSGIVPPRTNNTGPVYRYQIYEDNTERAFTVLIPEGWQTEGGIMQIPQHQVQTIVDGCGKKLYFSIYDPSSQSYITYFPTEMFHTAAPGTSMMNISPGQVLNGMMQMPRLMTPSEYVAQIVFPSSRPDASNVEWGNTKSLETLAAAWNQAFHSEDEIPPQLIAESIEVAYDRGGTRFAELWTALITSFSVHTSTVWTPDFAVVAGGPLDTVEKIAPVLKAVITSFRMNPTWMATTIARFDECTKGVAATQEKIRALDRKISNRLAKVQREMRSIDNEIVAGHDATRSSIQEHEYNTLMGNDEYEDTATGNRYILDLGYERNFTDGETIIQTDDWLFEPPPDYREMRNINISDN